MSDWIKKINGNSEIMPARGGSEILRDNLYKYTNLNKYDNINMIFTTPDYSKLQLSKKNFLWQHLGYVEESLAPMRDPSFMKCIDATVYVSHWQYEKFRYLFRIPLENAHVIKNAIDPIEFKAREKGEKIKLIYTSAPSRGLSILLNVMDALNRDDIELDVYSSTTIYGSGYEAHYYGVYDNLFNRAKETKNVNYIGYASNDDIRSALQSANIFAYPSICEETSCLSMIEAGAAGCNMVTTDIGALPETGSMYAQLMPIRSSEQQMVENYASMLNDCIENYWSLSNQSMLKEQSDFYNKYYSWEKRAKEWNVFFENLCENN